MLVDIDDLSEDEDSPSHELSHQGRLSAIHGAQRAFDFGSNLMRALQVRTYPEQHSCGYGCATACRKFQLHG